MTEVRQGATPCVHFRDVRFNEVSVKELTVYRSNDIYIQQNSLRPSNCLHCISFLIKHEGAYCNFFYLFDYQMIKEKVP